MHDDERREPRTEDQPSPLALGPAHWPAYAAAGVPLAPLADGPLTDLAQGMPVLLVGALVVAGASTVYRRFGGGRRRRRGVTLSPRTRARLRLRPGHGFASRGQLYRHYGRWPARRIAKHARRSLTLRDRWLGPWQEYATFHGRAQGLVHRWGVYSTFEDLVLMIGPPQEGKSQKAAASIIDAPGPVVVTSIRGDLIRDTVGLRQQRGYTWILNPEGVGLYGSNMRWNPVVGCEDIVAAVRRAGHMVEASENQGLSDASFWEDIGTMTLASLMHAAALMGGNLRNVRDWLAGGKEEITHLFYVLSEHGQASEHAAGVLWHLLNQMPEKTRESVITTLNRVLRFMIDPAVVETLCPPVGGSGDFDFEAFLNSKDTVYLVSSPNGYTTAPVFASFLAELVAVATAMGNRYEGADGSPRSRLDPPLTIEGDELANTAPVPVDSWASWASGSGIRIHMYFQSWARIRDRWGAEGAEALWGAAKCKVIGSGVTEEAVLVRMSRLIGKIDVREEDEITYDRRGNQRKRKRWSEVDIISPSEIRRIPRGKALVLRSSAAAPTIVTLDSIRRRRAYKQWQKAGAPVEGLFGIQQREIPTVRHELADPPPVPAPAPEPVDEIGARRARKDPGAAPPLPFPAQPVPVPDAHDSGADDPPAGWGDEWRAEWGTAQDPPPAPGPARGSNDDLPQGWSPWKRRSG
ncbi:hypothetical protein DMH08_31340 [Actinomadura sp. WAC 06369]|nr:hypothetical protein DMH08_31340 [Actinomadura sp. WAC 06369]